jgi:hypothetical protein
MNQHKPIHIVVEISETERRELEFEHDRVTGREIKGAAGVPLHSELFAIRGEKFHPVGNDEIISLKNGEHFAVIPQGAIHYTVNDEPQWTSEKELTPVKIMEHAGIDPGSNYLVEIKDHKPESFRDKPDERIHMHNGMKFITNFMGPKPVSRC